MKSIIPAITFSTNTTIVSEESIFTSLQIIVSEDFSELRAVDINC